MVSYKLFCMRPYATYSERLEWAMICAGLDPKHKGQTRLAEIVGCRPQTIQHLLNPDKNAKSSAFTTQIAKALECDVNWLASNEGPAPTLNEHKIGSGHPPNNAPKLPVIQESPTRHSHRIVGIQADPGSADVALLPREVPILSYDMAALMTPQLDPRSLGEPLGAETIHKPLSSSAFAIPVRDASMAPRFEAGREVLIIDPAWIPKPGKFVLARMRTGEAIFRKYREISPDAGGTMVFELTPLNTDFATLHSVRDGLTIIGVMAAYTHYEEQE